MGRTASCQSDRFVGSGFTVLSFDLRQEVDEVGVLAFSLTYNSIQVSEDIKIKSRHSMK